ncbi:MAG: hypothetical protein Q8P26_01985 [Candidatus Levybacteria bacterium]|nr:hypothetical protein [Candidatus Levybacteria bacterium]
MLLESAARPFAEEALPRRFRNMPTPYYAPERFGTNDSAIVVSRIGIDAQSFNGDIKRYLWGGNIEGINVGKHLGELAHIRVAIELQDGNETTWGPAVNVGQSDPNLGVEIITKPGIYGLYMGRQGQLFSENKINIKNVKGIILPATDLRRIFPKRYDALLKKSMDSIVKMMLSA